MGIQVAVILKLEKSKVKFTLEQTVKAQTEREGIALLFL
jgi:hypothetical protein